MNIKQIAGRLDGIQYPVNIPRDITDDAKANGLVIVFGLSDDLLEMRGAVEEEWGAYDGTIVHLDARGVVEDPFDEDDTDPVRLQEAKHQIHAVWAPKNDDVSWRIETDLPHERFNILEGDEVYCRGIVFCLKDLSS